MHLQNLLTKLFVLLPFFLTAAEYDDIVRQAYIETFSPIAIREMHRSNIPASIILAQAIVESRSGEGELARQTNNHFGIKCKGDWEGETFKYNDDEFDSKGNKVKSCFRKYTTVLDSYIDHTNFLLESRRYQDLFKFGRWDYKKWAWGLQEKHYATDPNYADKLIDVIETHQLYVYDLAEDFGEAMAFEDLNFNENVMSIEENNDSDFPAPANSRQTKEPLNFSRAYHSPDAKMESQNNRHDSAVAPPSEPSKRMRPIYHEPSPQRMLPK